MPSEKIHRTIHATSVPLSVSQGDPSPVTYRESVTVSWLPNGDVNLCIEHENLQGLEGEEPWAAGMTLDRAEINRLIKALRRARDAAYGRDE